MDTFLTDYDECQSNPCQHAGICINLSGGFVCVCAAGFTGSVCETGDSASNMNYFRLLHASNIH